MVFEGSWTVPSFPSSRIAKQDVPGVRRRGCILHPSRHVLIGSGSTQSRAKAGPQAGTSGYEVTEFAENSAAGNLADVHTTVVG